MTVFSVLQGQAVYVLYRDDGVLKLPYCIAIAGFVCAMFAFGIPYLSALRIWLGVSTILSLIYIIIAFVLSLQDGTYFLPSLFLPQCYADLDMLCYAMLIAKCVTLKINIDRNKCTAKRLQHTWDPHKQNI
jgi:hypothetical protein